VKSPPVSVETFPIVTVEGVSPVVLLNAAGGMGARCDGDAPLDAAELVGEKATMAPPRTSKVAVTTANVRRTAGIACSTRMSGMEILPLVQLSEYFIQTGPVMWE
jgi:hypothetical protein